MDYSQFLNMIPEATLMLALIIVFCADFALSKSPRKTYVLSVLTGALLLCQLVPCFMAEPTSAFGGLYVSSAIVNVMKTVLTLGTFIVVVMSQSWINNNATKLSGEFYILVISTLLGMYMMMSSGHFLMFFLGLEMASVPMACLVAFDRYKQNSAEAAAKYILTATFSSGVMLYGISFLYGAVGTLYFDDMAAQIQITPLTIMGMVFFFSGLGFKISLVPFHFWTADTYEGAPTPVTGYLSVVSKGAATLTLAIILIHVFGRLVDFWQPLLWIVIMLTITVGNLMAIRQSELKRFMAFSSISQAGYIMLAVVGNSTASLTALTFYVLVYVAANMAVFTVISTVEENNGGKTQMSAYLRVYGCCRWSRECTLLALLRGVHRPHQHGGQLVLLPAHRQGHVYHQGRESSAHLPQWRCHQLEPRHLHRGHPAVRHLLVHLRMD